MLYCAFFSSFLNPISTSFFSYIMWFGFHFFFTILNTVMKPCHCTTKKGAHTLKALTLTLCMGFSLIKACSYNIPSICTNNSVTRYETPANIIYTYEEERCTFNKELEHIWKNFKMPSQVKLNQILEKKRDEMRPSSCSILWKYKEKAYRFSPG